VALHRARNNNAISVAQDPTGTGIGAMKSCGNPIGHAATTIKLTLPKGLEVEQRSILVDAGNNTMSTAISERISREIGLTGALTPQKHIDTIEPLVPKKMAAFCLTSASGK
jgi:hypothetical protein